MADTDVLDAEAGRTLSQPEISAVSWMERLEAELLSKIASMPEDADGRWKALGKTHIEQGFMALRRAVVRPPAPVLPEGEG